ncbi:hypothetical protein EG68_03902 [Paragonimus skrjabini miyazakii]|uniref:Uncharacterized protein n=1 Tax=Paragonimus skrjabini miyazakii TaxID=59628 RepID=A0A8S9YAH6_9TREM|nr:hypothetical protein EG68_03902 [Paragonimus skrjabini miyazakii]
MCWLYCRSCGRCEGVDQVKCVFTADQTGAFDTPVDPTQSSRCCHGTCSSMLSACSEVDSSPHMELSTVTLNDRQGVRMVSSIPPHPEGGVSPTALSTTYRFAIPNVKRSNVVTRSGNGQM